MLSFLSPLNYVSSNRASQTKQKKQQSAAQGSEDSYVSRAVRTLGNGAGVVGSALALAFLPTANALPNGGDGGGGGHGDGSSGHGDGSASGSDAGHTSEFGSGTRDSGRTSSGLSSGSGLSHWNGVPAFILLDEGGAGDICQIMAFQSKNGSEFAMAGCDSSRMGHVKSALEQVCGGPRSWTA